MSLNTADLIRRLNGISPKALLTGVMIAGFLVSLPFWLQSTSEDKQYFQETAVKKAVEQSVGPLDIKPEEKEHLREMLKAGKAPEEKDFEQVVWVQDIVHLIQKWVPDESEATNIANGVYVYSKRFKLSPELVLAVIAVESRFDHYAVSNVGARGLMQVMPFWKNELGSSKDNLFEIETNLRYGCAILRYYIDRYGKLHQALAAYNGSLGVHKYPNKIYLMMKRFKATRLEET